MNGKIHGPGIPLYRDKKALPIQMYVYVCASALIDEGTNTIQNKNVLTLL